MTKPPTEVQAFLCGVCGSLHRRIGDAIDCCICRKCETPFATVKRNHEDFCAHCLYGPRLRDARKVARGAQERLDGAEAWVQRMLSSGKPKKGSR